MKNFNTTLATLKEKARKMIAGLTINALVGAATASAPTLEALVF